MQVNWAGILLILFLVLLNAFFAASEIAVISSRRVKIQRLKEEGSTSASVLLKLIDDPSLFLATIQVGITLAGFLASATAAVGLSKGLTELLINMGLPSAISNTLGVFLVTLVISYITLIFGELAPKRLAMQWSEKLALKVARPINFIAKVTSPVTRFLTFSTNLIVRILGGNPKQTQKEITEDEIRFYIAEHRTLPAEEKSMIEGVFNFGDQVVRQVMVPRTEIVYLHVSYTVKQALDKVCTLKFSAFPVYEKDYDDIVGIARLRDIVNQALMNQEEKITEIMGPVLFVPETKPTVALLKEFRVKGSVMAIVVDEYGGTAGLVTKGDLVDEIIGDIIQEERLIRKTPHGDWLVEGDTPIHDVFEALELKRVKSNSDYETIAGFILDRLGHLPEEGETLHWGGYSFQVKDMGTTRINRLLIARDDKTR